ncbi:LacI family DNA-binding transcriptional regulator [Aquibacillus kalidii]|uniref:LacI family DNA-binding transcriptional regulator n=1 Tax=Aquibacillus kalidii TaxID=2762597 RepID=UPI001643FC0E|nr:LacI family DNA-binding transcriptional regulator [Aquibacillus kalidii]
MTNKPTIRDVAKHANVSPATVSYVLNGVKKVSDKTKIRVLEAIEQLGYYPDFTAVSLSKRKSNLIGIMLPLTDDMPDNATASVLKNNLYYNEFISGVEMVAREQQFDTLLTGVADQEECRKWVKKRNLDGLIFLGIFPKSIFEQMSKLGIPIVLIDTYEEYTKLFNNVQIDDELGGYLAANHLIKLGHKNIAFVSTNLNLSPVDTKRFTGFKKALNEAGLEVNNHLLFETREITFENGMEIAEKILNENKELTGIVTVSDILAIGMIKAFQYHQKHVPNDFSIVGFDDLSISQFTTPSLTTIKQDIFKKGEKAAELLMNNIGDQGVERQIIELPVQLVVRESTKKIVSN